jgi:hypothetical protein
MGKVIDIEKNQPHVVIKDSTGNAHVVPVSVLIRVATGTMPITDLEEYKLIVPVIIKEWLLMVAEDYCD